MTNLLHIGCSPLAILDSVNETYLQIKNIVVMIEFTDETNGVYYNDMQNEYEIIGRLMAMINHIQDKQQEETI
jgi:hypothetical protein